MANPLMAVKAAEPYNRFERTGRPYVYDLCDHYNRNRSERAKRLGMEWFVMPSGELKFATTQERLDADLEADKARKEAERQQWKHRRQYPAQKLIEGDGGSGC